MSYSLYHWPDEALEEMQNLYDGMEGNGISIRQFYNRIRKIANMVSIQEVDGDAFQEQR